MNNAVIRTYNDLLAEQQRLQTRLEVHKNLIKSDIDAIKKNLTPVSKTLAFFTDSSVQKNAANSALTTGIDLMFDVWLKRSLFRNANWLITILGSSVVKRVSSTVIEKKPIALIKKFLSSKKLPFIGKGKFPQ